MAAACCLTPQSCSALIRRRLQRSCGSQTKQRRPRCGHTAAALLRPPAVLSARGRDAAKSIRRRIHALLPEGCSRTPPPCQVVAHCSNAVTFVCIALAAGARGRAGESPAEGCRGCAGSDAEERARAGGAGTHRFRFVSAQCPPHVFAFEPQQMWPARALHSNLLPLQVAALQRLLEEQQVPVRPSRLHIT